MSGDPRVIVDTEAARERILEAMTGDAVYSSDGAARELDAFVAARLEAAETALRRGVNQLDGNIDRREVADMLRAALAAVRGERG